MYELGFFMEDARPTRVLEVGAGAAGGCAAEVPRGAQRK